MTTTMSIGNMLNSLIPISRFNKGEAAKIFDEVNEAGCKIVVKNNAPACVLITPEKYQELLEMLDDEYLYSLAMERLQNSNDKSYSMQQVMVGAGISEADLADGEDVEIE